MLNERIEKQRAHVQLSDFTYAYALLYYVIISRSSFTGFNGKKYRFYFYSLESPLLKAILKKRKKIPRNELDVVCVII